MFLSKQTGPKRLVDFRIKNICLITKIEKQTYLRSSRHFRTVFQNVFSSKVAGNHKIIRC